MKRVEVGTIQMVINVKGGEVLAGYPRMDILQDNLREAAPLLPDGEYQWQMTMTLANANRADRTIQSYVDEGVIACPTCGSDRVVAKDAQVAPCKECNDGRYWNLMVSTAVG